VYFNSATITWRRALLENLIVAWLVKKFPTFLEPKGSLPYTEGTATDPVISQMDAGHNFTSYLLKTHFNIALRSMPRSPK